jgi:DNA-binding PadR family transcriptional regulator
LGIASDLIRGHTEAIILANLSNGDGYGYRINKSVQEATGRRYELKEATLYTAFKRLEEAGSIRSYWGDETGGPRRRYYSITPEGLRQLERMRRDWEAVKDIIDSLINIGTKIREEKNNA